MTKKASKQQKLPNDPWYGMKAPTPQLLPSGQYHCRIRINGQSHYITKSSPEEVITEAWALKTGIKKAPAKVESITLERAMENYCRDRDGILSPSTLRGYGIIRRNRFQELMKKPVAKLTFSMIQKAVNQEAKICSPKTVRNAYGLLTVVLGEYRPDLDLARINLPQKQEVDKKIYTPDELQRYLAQVRGTNVELPVLLAAWLGMRRSEIIGLRWEDVDFENGEIRIREALVPDENNQFQVKGTKTVKSRRTIPCPQYILDLISRQERTGERIIQVAPHTIHSRMARAAKAAGVPSVGLHALRHQNASIMLALNIPDKYAMKRGGWSTNQTMKDIYQHVFKEGEQEAAVAIDQYFEGITQTEAPKKPKRYRLVRHL